MNVIKIIPPEDNICFDLNCMFIVVCAGCEFKMMTLHPSSPSVSSCSQQGGFGVCSLMWRMHGNTFRFAFLCTFMQKLDVFVLWSWCWSVRCVLLCSVSVGWKLLKLHSTFRCFSCHKTSRVIIKYWSSCGVSYRHASLISLLNIITVIDYIFKTTLLGTLFHSCLDLAPPSANMVLNHSHGRTAGRREGYYCSVDWRRTAHALNYLKTVWIIGRTLKCVEWVLAKSLHIKHLSSIPIKPHALKFNRAVFWNVRITPKQPSSASVFLFHLTVRKMMELISNSNEGNLKWRF